eukprot:CAMPEP_0117427574 /NCGR_PEP_ID=MMETSP0758-20121206/7403_1 /TAXON_ID=63605 /ORGANISM="Percolomonas cosmopolitus, Strain AE-1 (ATCC 50343)" /LENGTH=431 /DNA_ID=CAMNT_0005213309 /DNA_START=1261 /DNA_END=2556 /DNA_ORIENTATION=+
MTCIYVIILFIVDRMMMRELLKLNPHNLFDDPKKKIVVEFQASFFREIRQVQHVISLFHRRIQLYRTVSPKLFNIIEQHFQHKTEEDDFMGEEDAESVVQSTTTTIPVTSTPVTPSYRSRQYTFAVSPTASVLSPDTDNGVDIKNILGIKYVPLTILTIRINNAYPLSSSMTDTFVEQHTEFMRIIYERVNTSHAHLLYFSISKVILVWTEKEAINHTVRACTIAQTLNSKLKQLNDNWIQPFEYGFGIASTDTSKSVGFGYVGLSNLCTPVVIGNVLDVSENLAKLCATWNTPILMEDAVYCKAVNQFLARPIEKRHVITLRTSQERICNVNVYELGAVREQVHGKEWLYEMKSRLMMKQWELFNEAFHLFETKRYDKALAKFELFERTLTSMDLKQDIPTKRLITLCRDRLQTASGRITPVSQFDISKF